MMNNAMSMPLPDASFSPLVPRSTPVQIVEMPSFPSISSISNISVSDIKGKALKAKTASAHQFANARDKYSSTSSTKYQWDPTVKPSPPPPPTKPSAHRTSSSTSSTRAPPLPPPTRTGDWHRPRPSADSTSQQTPTHTPSPSSSSITLASPQVVSLNDDVASHSRFDWKNMTEDDKQVFFGWLDEFFESRFGVSGAAKSGVQQASSSPAAAAAPTVQRTSRAATPPKPPTLPMWSRPQQPTINEADPNDFTPSYPPPTMHGSEAADLAHFFSPSTHWDSPWYSSAEVPPPLQNEAPPSSTRSWEVRGSMKTIWGGVMFPDLSMCWYSVQFSTTANADPNDARAVQRSAKYLARPGTLDRAALVAAHETYGETIAAYAESYEGTGQYCARGECWDLAAEALKYFDQYDYVPKPVPSMSRTHGHLIFCGRAARGGAEQVGRWRGGDDRVRRGDIAEWRTARVRMAAGGFMTLGAPDHTAVIVSDSVPQIALADGAEVRPAQLGSLEVVEQSVGSPPKRTKYDLSLFEEGELWIYRPVGLLEYVGALLEPRCPDNVNALSV